MPWILFIGAEVAIERSTILHLTSVMQHALKRLLPAIERAILADPYRGRHWSQARPSVIHKHTRLWIHQGLWWRHAKKTDRIFFVMTWQLNRPSVGKDAQRIDWGSLLPVEDRLGIKGQWLDGNGLPLLSAQKRAVLGK
jgi:hypothetical protein